jgi:hypothetical protein
MRGWFALRRRNMTDVHFHCTDAEHVLGDELFAVPFASVLGRLH